MATFESLPAELIETIASKLLLPERKCLRTVNSYFNSIVEPLVFNTVTLDLDVKLDQGIPLIVALSGQGQAETNRISKYVRKLIIKSLAFHFEAQEQKIRTVMKREKSESRVALELEEEGTEEEMMKHCLRLALESLANLTSFSWSFSPGDPQWTRDMIPQALSNLPLLYECSIESYVYKLPPFQLRNLRKISLVGSTLRGREAVWNDLLIPFFSSIVRSPDLSRLEFSFGPWLRDRGTEYKVQLGELLDELSRQLAVTHGESKVLKIEHLTLRGCRTALTPNSSISLNHLDYLTSLDLGDVDTPASRQQSSSTLWNELRNRGIRLREIVVRRLEHSLLNYLDSYEGLEKFMCWSIRSVEGATPREAPNLVGEGGLEIDELLLRFYKQTIPRHSGSLVSLRRVFWLSRTPRQIMKCDRLPQALFTCHQLQELAFTIEGTRSDMYTLLPLSLLSALKLPLLRRFTLSIVDEPGTTACIPMHVLIPEIMTQLELPLGLAGRNRFLFTLQLNTRERSLYYAPERSSRDENLVRYRLALSDVARVIRPSFHRMGPGMAFGMFSDTASLSNLNTYSDW